MSQSRAISCWVAGLPPKAAMAATADPRTSVTIRSARDASRAATADPIAPSPMNPIRSVMAAP